MHLTAHAAFADVEADWKRFEQSGIVSPYQTANWVKCWSDTVAPAIGMQPMFVTVRDASDGILAILPLGLQIRQSVRVVRFLGGKHANYNIPVFARDGMQHITPEHLAAALQTFGKAQDIDLYVFDNLPVSWSGMPNPLAALKSMPSPSSAWKCALKPDGDQMIQELMSSESRKKLRNKEKRLSTLGPIAYQAASKPEEIAAALAAFLHQKAARFATLGIHNPFSDTGVVAFLEKATARMAQAEPPINLFTMQGGDRILAVFGGAIHAGRYTGMFTSFDTDPEVSRFSPGDLLLVNLIKHLCKAGLHTFDLGTGEAGYKNDYCDSEEPLVDCLLPVSLKGQMALRVLAMKQHIKRQIKQSEAAMNLVKRLRKLQSS